ncbi:hypothetical protein AB0N17_33685 [Streptomyces sp. NPDC051133]|uniref:hypothetical protein n=1 Tax=Streptomyces sp. NPDC051133 TaxID=3155521 RepID=UPI00341BBC2A
MIISESTLTPETGEYGYLLALGEDYEWPPQWPYGWRCGPIGTDTAHILTDTDTGTITITVQTRDEPPPPETDPAWGPAEEMSLHATQDTPVIYILGSGDFDEAEPEDGPLQLPTCQVSAWIRMRLYCHTPAPELSGTGGRGERHLIQLWTAPEQPPVHPELTESDLTRRHAYKEDFDQGAAAWRQ